MFRTMRTDRLTPNPDQPRKLFDPVALAELGESIKTSGLLQPIVVRPVDIVRGAPGGYQIIAGERRWRAATAAGIPTVTVRVIEGLDDEQAYVMSIAENVARTDMTVIEEARAFDTLRSLGRDPAAIAALFGKTEAYVSWRLDLLTLNPAGVALVEKGQLKPLLAFYVAACQPANQSFILTRYCSGSFATEQEAVAFAQAVKANEDAPVMFGAVETEQVRADRRVASSDARRRMDRVAALTGLLVELSAADPADLAAALGSSTSAEAARFETLYAAALSARKVMRKARAIAQVTTVDGAAS